MEQENNYIEVPVEDFASHIVKGDYNQYLLQLKSQSDLESKKIKIMMGGLLSLPLNEAIDVSSYIPTDATSRVVISGMTPEIRDIMDLSKRIK